MNVKVLGDLSAVEFAPGIRMEWLTSVVLWLAQAQRGTHWLLARVLCALKTILRSHYPWTFRGHTWGSLHRINNLLHSTNRHIFFLSSRFRVFYLTKKSWRRKRKTKIQKVYKSKRKTIKKYFIQKEKEQSREWRRQKTSIIKKKSECEESSPAKQTVLSVFPPFGGPIEKIEREWRRINTG